MFDDVINVEFAEFVEFADISASPAKSFDEVKANMNKKEILNGLTLIALQSFFINIERT